MRFSLRFFACTLIASAIWLVLDPATGTRRHEPPRLGATAAALDHLT